VEIFQNCNIFNDKAFEGFTERTVRDDQTVDLVPGDPAKYGKEHDRGLHWTGTRFETVAADHPDLYVHDPAAEDPTFAFALTRLQPPAAPMPIGIFRDVTRPPLEERIHEQLRAVKEKRGEGTLEALLDAGETWEVKG
jgi:2-oxoglutarate ferredoxin oxidoreductase subunit beta